MIKLDELLRKMPIETRESVIISTPCGTLHAYDNRLDRYDVVSMEALDLSDGERIILICAREI